MPFLIGKDSVDTADTDGNCLYPAKALGGSPTVSPNVYVNGSPLETYDATSVPDQVDGQKINPSIPAPCIPGVRVVTPTVNTTVFINGKLPAVQGDEAKRVSGGTPRPIVGPFQHTNLHIG